MTAYPRQTKKKRRKEKKKTTEGEKREIEKERFVRRAF